MAITVVAMLLVATWQGAASAQEAGTAPESTASGSQGSQGAASQNADELAKKLSNPVSSLVSVPFQMSWNEGIGPEDARNFVLNFQPVMPFSMNDDWNAILRVITPYVAQPALVEGGHATSGIGDLLVSLFFSPKEGGLIWGVGPVVSLPVSADPALGSGNYGLGPTFVALKQSGPWTYGALLNQIWGIRADPGREDLDQLFLQPFLAYVRNGWTYSFNTEAAYNWNADSGQGWTVPIYLSLTKLLKLGHNPISIGGGPRFYVDKPDGGPDWGFRFQITLLFPTGG